MSSPDIVDISAQPAVVTWTADDQTCCRLEALRFHIFHDPSTNAAFFKLRAPVTFQATVAKPKRTTAVWLFIAPERIATLALQEEDKIEDATRKQLGPDTVCLRFDLNRSATLVLPPDIDQDCKEQASGATLEALQSLTRATSFVISASLPGRTVSQAHLLSLCKSASRSTAESTSTSGTLVSSKHAADTTSLYGGKGSRVIEGDSPALSATTATDLSPPPYAKIGASPPLMPASGPEKKRRRRASSDAGPDPGRQHPSEAFELRTAFEKFKNELRSELKQDLRSELLVELKAEVKHELRAELKAELKNELISEVMQEVETRIFQRVEHSLQDQAIDYEAQLYDIRHEIGSTVYSEVEDQTYVARKELEDVIKDEMDEVQKQIENRIVDRLQNANLNLTFFDQ